MRSASFVKTAPVVVLLASMLGTAGCGNDSPNSPTESPTTATVTFSSNLAVKGASSRSFEVTRAGNVSVTLLSVGGSATLSVGLGLGIPESDGSGCVLSRSVETVAGTTAQLDLAVDVGEYCVEIYDPGTLVGNVGFTINLIYPILATT